MNEIKSTVLARQPEEAPRHELCLERLGLAQELRALGITLVEASYAGHGDAGNVTDLSAVPSRDAAGSEDCQLKHMIQTQPEDALELTDRLSNFVWDIVQSKHASFENDQGGSGHMVWNVTDDVIDLEHIQLVAETTRSEDLDKDIMDELRKNPRRADAKDYVEEALPSP